MKNVAVLDPREQRKLAVAKLKLAVSLLWLEGGRGTIDGRYRGLRCSSIYSWRFLTETIELF